MTVASAIAIALPLASQGSDTAQRIGVAHRSVPAHLLDGTASSDRRWRQQANPLRYTSAAGSSVVERRGDCAAHRAIRFYQRRYAEHRARMGIHAIALTFPTAKCPRYAAKVWQRKAAAWRVRAENYRTLRDFDVRPGYSGWRRAVDEVQRAYPGTKAWLLSCSASEGGWGRWVWNTQGSGCGGWLQFMQPTFNGFSWRALSDVRRRGFRVPPSARSWLSPLGQALAGAWAYTNGLSHHWYGRGCRGA